VKNLIILVDAMGGDNAPDAIVNGCIDAINEQDGFDILLIGDSVKIDKILKQRRFSNPRLKINHTDEVITGHDMPTRAIRSKKNSSMVIGFNLLKEKKGDVFLSAGNSGALLAGALLLIGRLKGVDRPALGAIIPTKTGRTLLIDAGLNSVCKPINLLQFGTFGSVYMKEMFGLEQPRIGLVNIGSEDSKGNDAVRQAFSMLSESNLNFVGNIEGNDVIQGKVDVVVCDGFVGNVMLKLLEGAASFMFGAIKEMYTKSVMAKLSALAIKKDLKIFASKLDSDENGGAPILGVDGLVFKSHGSSNTKTIKNVVLKAFKIANTSMMDKLRSQFINMEVGNIEFSG
jgi:glycerol-3-phosphate acyltransferase PlsX